MTLVAYIIKPSKYFNSQQLIYFFKKNKTKLTVKHRKECSEFIISPSSTLHSTLGSQASWQRAFQKAKIGLGASLMILIFHRVAATAEKAFVPKSSGWQDSPHTSFLHYGHMLQVANILKRIKWVLNLIQCLAVWRQRLPLCLPVSPDFKQNSLLWFFIRNWHSKKANFVKVPTICSQFSKVSHQYPKFWELLFVFLRFRRSRKWYITM